MPSRTPSNVSRFCALSVPGPHFRRGRLDPVRTVVRQGSAVDRAAFSFAVFVELDSGVAQPNMSRHKLEIINLRISGSKKDGEA